MTKYTDREEHDALKDGARALRDCLARLSAEWGDDVKARMDELRDNAVILDQMADCYNVPLVRDPESWQAVAAEGAKWR